MNRLLYAINVYCSCISVKLCASVVLYVSCFVFGMPLYVCCFVGAVASFFFLGCGWLRVWGGGRWHTAGARIGDPFFPGNVLNCIPLEGYFLHSGAVDVR